MHDAAQSLLGEHDFSAFRAAGCQSRTPMRRLIEITVHRNDWQVEIEIEANAFVYHMVRNIVGSLIRIGQAQADVGWMAELLAGRDRKRAAPTAPAQGLYFLHARYPQEYGVPSGR